MIQITIEELTKFYEARLLNDKGMDMLIDMLSHPDRRDLDKEISNKLPPTEHEADKSKRSMERSQKE